MKESILDHFTVDFTKLAREGKLDPVIGRDEEIRRVIQILSRRSKNNPLLIGDPGVGKSAIVEGLAQRIINNDVPLSLLNKRLLMLDLTAILAGAKFKGEFEERLKYIIKEIQDSKGEIITFLDEIHNLVGAGGGQGSIDAGNILKPLLARGELRLIGATTFDEYREHIEKDMALERRFQSVKVDEPSVDDAIAILRGLKERYEKFHNISISDSALTSACLLSDRYITNRKLPDKAIDLIDEASSKLKMQIESVPFEVDILMREIDKLKMEEYQLKKESDKNSKIKDEEIKDLIKLKEGELSLLKVRWEEEKRLLEKIANLKADIEVKKSQAEISQREGNLEVASRILYSELPLLEQDLKKMQDDLQSRDLILPSIVTEKEIGEIISSWTKIPLSKISEKEGEKYLNLKKRISSKLIGQDQALEIISSSLIRSRSGIVENSRPIGVFLLSGPTGVGKTELAKLLAEDLFDDEKALIRIDMSEYSESHNVSRLIGAPPGYIGFEEGGQLTEKVRHNPFSVILLDEIEKANPSVYDILLQIFDDGRLTDGQGRVVSFKNTIILLTSNLGSEILLRDDVEEKSKLNQYNELLRRTFKPEFINRLDDVILFKPLSHDDIEKISLLNLRDLELSLQSKGNKLILEKSALEWISHRGYDLLYGARPLKRVIERYVINPLGEMYLRKEISEGQSVVVRSDNLLDENLKISILPNV